MELNIHSIKSLPKAVTYLKPSDLAKVKAKTHEELRKEYALRRSQQEEKLRLTSHGTGSQSHNGGYAGRPDGELQTYRKETSIPVQRIRESQPINEPAYFSWRDVAGFGLMIVLFMAVGFFCFFVGQQPEIDFIWN